MNLNEFLYSRKIKRVDPLDQYFRLEKLDACRIRQEISNGGNTKLRMIVRLINSAGKLFKQKDKDDGISNEECRQVLINSG